MNTIGQISEINFKIGEIFISEWTLSLRELPLLSSMLLFSLMSLLSWYCCVVQAGSIVV